VFQPLRLLAPERFALEFGRRSGGEVAVDQGKVRLAPIEGIIRLGAHQVVVLARVALVVAGGGGERSFSKQLPLRGEENRPERAIGAVLHQVARMNDKVRVSVL